MNWYETAFGSKYLEVYSHRDGDEATRALALIEQVCDLQVPGTMVLDLACGQGRYSRQLAAKGHSVAALDLSMPLLERGRASQLDSFDRGGTVWFVRADMRAVPFKGGFDLAINMFTSFGYFENDADNVQVLEQIEDALKPGGKWVIDYLNRPRVIATLVPEDHSEKSGLKISQYRRLGDSEKRVVKDVKIEGPEGSQQWTESVRMYGRREMEYMLEGAGLTLEKVYGDYDLSAHGEDSSRLILTGHK
jgi:SAM-dependent methyltransferase